MISNAKLVAAGMRVAAMRIVQKERIAALAIEWEKLRSPQRWLVSVGRGDEITEAEWLAFHNIETALAEAVWELTGKPSVPPEAYRSTFKVVK
jgi:hypothetical protein